MLLHFSPAQGLVRLTLAEQLSGKQHDLMADLAKKAVCKWEGEQHPGWTPAGVASQCLLADLQRFQVLACACGFAPCASGFAAVPHMGTAYFQALP